MIKFRKGYVYTIRDPQGYYYWPNSWRHWKESRRLMGYRSVHGALKNAKRISPGETLVVEEFQQELYQTDSWTIDA